MSRAPSRIRHDYKATLDRSGRTSPRPAKWLLLVTASVIAGITLYFAFLHTATGNRTPQSTVQSTDSLTAELPLPVIETNAQTERNNTPVKRSPSKKVVDLPLPAAPPTNDSMQTPDTPARTRKKTTEIRDVPLPVTTPSRVAAKPVDKPPAKKARIQSTALPLPALAARATNTIASPEPDPNDRLSFEIASGDTLDQLFAKHKLNRSDLAEILQIKEARSHLQLLRPGDKLSVEHQEGEIIQLSRVLDEEQTLNISRAGDKFSSQIDKNPVEKRIAHAFGRINSSLFMAAQEIGISDTLIMNLAGIFAWDVDFVLDIRRGDSFTVLYEELWQDGEKLRDGEILAAEFTNSGKTFRAVRFEDPEGNSGYFTPEGLSVKKAFLRAPIAITPRVTSSFNPRRMHPVKKKVLPHTGVDYRAPTGTPIKAAGDGKVIFRGRKGGYGNAIILQHGGNITTLYAHLSKFHSRAGRGKRVKQGQIIGYSGATGTVTAAHLHYEYRVSGVHRNPRTVKLPKARPVASKHRELFAETTAPLLQQLDVLERSFRLAAGNTN